LNQRERKSQVNGRLINFILILSPLLVCCEPDEVDLCDRDGGIQTYNSITYKTTVSVHDYLLTELYQQSEDDDLIDKIEESISSSNEDACKDDGMSNDGHFEDVECNIALTFNTTAGGDGLISFDDPDNDTDLYEIDNLIELEKAYLAGGATFAFVNRIGVCSGDPRETDIWGCTNTNIAPVSLIDYPLFIGTESRYQVFMHELLHQVGETGHIKGIMQGGRCSGDVLMCEGGYPIAIDNRMEYVILDGYCNRFKRAFFVQIDQYCADGKPFRKQLASPFTETIAGTDPCNLN